jgi:hypothetical protein
MTTLDAARERWDDAVVERRATGRLALRGARARIGATFSAALLATGCGGGSPTPPAGPSMPAGEMVAAFSLPDVNPASPRFGQVVSPRDYLGQVSAWYFGHAT